LRQPGDQRVVVALKGGLGNQLFQLACGLWVARRAGASLLLDSAWFAKQDKRTVEIEPLVAVLPDVSFEPGAAAEMSPELTYRERGYRFDPRLAEVTPPVALRGHFPQPRYVQPVLDELRAVLLSRSLMSPWAVALAESMPDVTVGVHVRRGDYVEEPTTAAHHGVCSVDYYERAWKLISHLDPSPAAVVYSDDVAWARANLRFPGAEGITVIDPPEHELPLQSLMLLARSTHWIIANSTFSWWGAALGRRPNGVTIAPRPWWANEKSVDRDLLWPDWLTIDARPNWETT